MYKTPSQAAQYVSAFLPLIRTLTGVEVALCPPFVDLTTVAAALRRGRGERGTEVSVALGAQDVFWEDEGAFTGEVAPGMLVDAGCQYVIIGHSERRQYFGETDEQVNRKVKAALSHGLRPIICVGESLAQREAGQSDEVVRRQTRAALAGLTPDQAAGLVIAYEPIWAIGTGRNATGEEANRVIGIIRQVVGELYPGQPQVAQSVRIQYGGSVKPNNAAEFLGQPEVDGALVGGASLDPQGFATLCQLAAEAAADRARSGQ